MSVRYLTKSRFKVGFECPTKLHFLDNVAYGSTKTDNAFLEALAEGGFQVGELAKLYFPGGVEVETLEKSEALKQTAALLAKPTAIVYEGAVQFGNLFIRADVLVKNGDRIDLIEVKAKSFDPHEEDQFYNKTSLKKGVKKLNTAWEPYLLDVAFQCFVVKAAFPSCQVTGSLMLADKAVTASVNGINQKFLLRKDARGRTSAHVSPGVSGKDLGTQLLVRVPVDEEIEIIWNSTYEVGGKVRAFSDLVSYLETICVDRSFAEPIVGSHCKTCEFRIPDSAKNEDTKSGFEACWQRAEKLSEADFRRQFTFEVWNFRKAQSLIENGKLFIDQIEKEDINPSDNGEGGLSSSERQWVQVEKVLLKDQDAYLDKQGLASEMSTWSYPLHFIDFETSMVAIPFHKGRRPYEQIAFQFSHHRIDQDGTITHCDEYINQEKGKFPNFDFVRALKKSLETDVGTIFRYAAHENTVLCQIKEQLLNSGSDIHDQRELIEFIDTVTTYSSPQGKPISGKRSMVDLCELVKKYFYHPQMRGSNSIKKVLPAILSASSFLKEKYGKPIYGAKKGIHSRNFKDWTWIEMDSSGAIKDPYKKLPPIFSDIALDEMDALLGDGSIADGGAAMTAYSRMQFTEMTEIEANAVVAGLLKYCELDTLAMVMIFEYWNSEVGAATSVARKTLKQGDRACLPRKKSKKQPKIA